MVLETTAGDGEAELRAARVYKTIAKGEKPDAILRSVAEGLGVSLGNLQTQLGKLRTRGVASMFPEGGVLYGSAASQMDRVCSAYGLEWSIQKGLLQILERNKPVSTDPVFELSSDSGLLGSPKYERQQGNVKPGKHVGEIDFECLLNPLLMPGYVLSIKSKFVKGAFRITEVDHKGDTFTAGDWKTEGKAKAY